MGRSRKHGTSCICQELKKLNRGTVVEFFLKSGNQIINLDYIEGNCFVGHTTEQSTSIIDCRNVLGFSILPTAPTLIERQIFEFTGAVVTITVPASATTATIQAIGAAGGIGTSANGFGASIQGDFTVTPGETLSILVGQQGQTGEPSPGFFNGGGGGGSFVWRGNGPVTPSNLLVAAGAGGGASEVEGNPGVNASLTSSGTAGNPGGAGGTNGRGGSASDFSAGGGAGILPSPLGDGGSFLGKGGQSIFNGGAGGAGLTSGSDGGFGGGGGGGFAEGGGGGGFSGGGGGGTGNFIGGGGGGGSQNNGANQVNVAGGGTGNGQVTISFFGV